MLQTLAHSCYIYPERTVFQVCLLSSEGAELSDDQDIIITNQEQHLSEEQTYREIMGGIHSFMGWSHIPEMDSATNPDNLFTSPKTPVLGKVSVQMPTEVWLCSVES